MARTLQCNFAALFNMQNQSNCEFTFDNQVKTAPRNDDSSTHTRAQSEPIFNGIVGCRRATIKTSELR